MCLVLVFLFKVWPTIFAMKVQPQNSNQTNCSVSKVTEVMLVA